MTLKAKSTDVFVILACVATVPLALSAPKGASSSAILVLFPVAILVAGSVCVPSLRRWGQHGAALLFSFLLVAAARCMVPLPGGASALYEYHISPVVLILPVLAAVAANTGTGCGRKDRLASAVSITGVLVLASAILAYILLSRFYVLEPQILRKTAQNIVLIGVGVFLFKVLTRNNASIPVLVVACISATVVIWSLDAGIGS